MSKPFTELEIESIMSLVDNHSLAEIGRILGRPHQSIYRKWIELVRTRRIRSSSQNRFAYLFTFLNDRAQEMNILVLSYTHYEVQSLYLPIPDTMEQEEKFNYAIGQINQSEYTYLASELPTIYLNNGEKPMHLWVKLTEFLRMKNLIG